MDTKTNPSLEQALWIVRRRAIWILVCFVVATGVAFASSRHQIKKYTATASLVFNNNQLSQQVAGLQVSGSGDPQMQQQTNVKLVELGSLASTAKLVGRGLTQREIQNSL